MDVPVQSTIPAYVKLANFQRLTLPKLVRSYGELAVLSEEVEESGDLLCLMENALLLVRLSIVVEDNEGLEMYVDREHPHVIFKVFLHQVTGVRISEQGFLFISTTDTTLRLSTNRDNVYYTSWQPDLPFVSLRRMSMEIRLRSATTWSYEDQEEADHFSGRPPVGDPSRDRLDALYGSVIRAGEIRLLTPRRALLWKKDRAEKRLLVLRETALLLHPEHVMGKKPTSIQDQCIYLCALYRVSTSPESPSCVHLSTLSNKTYTFFLDSPVVAQQWLGSLRAAVDKIRSCPKRIRITTLEHLRHLTTQITIPEKPLASGSFASVYEGSCEAPKRGRRAEDWTRRTVAVKVFQSRFSEDPSFEKKLLRELDIWSKLDHPNVLPLLGITYDIGTALSIVIPWLPKGTLHMSLKTRSGLDEVRPLLQDVANGLTYLHLQDVIHGNLHPGNILIGDDGHAQLTDFGLSRVGPDFESTSQMLSSSFRAGSARWAAPEQLLERTSDDGSLYISKLSDIYSLGGVIYQVICGDVPFANIQNEIRVIMAVRDGQRPDRVPLISEVNWRFLNRCWDAVPVNRPSLSEIHDFLDNRVEKLPYKLHEPRRSPPPMYGPRKLSINSI